MSPNISSACRGLTKLSAEQVVVRLEMAQIANGKVRTMSDVWAHAQLRAPA